LKLRVALIQTRTPDTEAAAVAHLEPLLRAAATGGAQLILTPEGSNILQRDRARLLPALRPLLDGPLNALCGRVAEEFGVWVLAGSVLARGAGGDRAENVSLLWDGDAGLVGSYEKIHLFDADLPGGERVRESEAFAPGDRAVVAETPWGGLGLSICYDLRFPQLYRALAQAGAGMFAVPAAFTRPTGEAHWEALLRARAIENGAWVLAPAQGGRHADGRETWGRSMIVDPWGRVAARLDHDEPGVLLAEIELDAVERARRALPSLRHDRAFAAP
jgi:predicted amidohydrolase